MPLLMDQIHEKLRLKKKRDAESEKAQAVTGVPGKISDAEWKEHIKKRAAENLRKAGAKLAEKSS